MNLISITINHKTAPVEIREAFTLSNNDIYELLSKLTREYIDEGLIISTCNRTEIFAVPKNSLLIHDKLIDELINYKSVVGIKKEHFVGYFACTAVKHFFSVAAGIDSQVIGDSQILGQVKEAVQFSEENNFAGKMLSRLFDTAVRVGKRAIKETQIGEGAVSVSYAAVQVIEKIFNNIENKSALVIGAGETGELAAIHLKDKGIGKITITNRTKEKAEILSDKIHGETLSFNYLKEQIHNYDIIISATSADGFILTYDDIKNTMKKRKYLPICIMDIAVPRDIDPKSTTLDNVFYNDIDSLRMIVDQNIKKRENEIPIIQNIIMQEMVDYYSWVNALDVVPTVKNLRNFFEEMRLDELEKIRNKVNKEDFVKIEDMTKRLIGRLLHNPTKNIRRLAESGNNYEQTVNSLELIKEIFNLEKNTKNNE